jgi:hypothetical protein
MKSNNSTQKIMYLNPVGFDAYDAFFAEMSTGLIMHL